MATLISIPEAARLLGISRQRVWVLLKNGKLGEAHKTPAPHLPSKFQHMVDKAEVDKRIAAQSTP